MRPPSVFPVAESSDLKRLIRFDGAPGRCTTGPVLRRRRKSYVRVYLDSDPTEAVMASVLFIVSCAKPGTYNYMKLVSENKDVVILDRRMVDRRRIDQRATPERRHGERRRHNVMTDLKTSGWALVRR